jgi:hypothetical protein
LCPLVLLSCRPAHQHPIGVHSRFLSLMPIIIDYL